MPVIVTSGPSSVWPKKAYRNPTDQLVAFLDRKHGEDWSIFEFRAEGTGYPDSEVYGRIHHFPWPDHHPPPFAIIPNLMAAMRNWLQAVEDHGLNDEKRRRVAVVHCKAGKGRSGTVACSYLISEAGWTRDNALQRFTERRMRVGFGQGVSIPSQLRWVGYVDHWTNRMNKTYVERPIEIVEVHVWGLRDGVKVAVEGYMEQGRRIKVFHTFNRGEKTVVDDGKLSSGQIEPPFTKDVIAPSKITSQPSDDKHSSSERLVSHTSATAQLSSISLPSMGSTQNVILRPSTPINLETSDVNIDFERRSQASSYTGVTMVTSIAHVWFNAYFEGGHEGHSSGVFEIDWDAMDGVKGSPRKGTKSLDRLKVVWKYTKSSATESEAPPQTIHQTDEEVPPGKIITEPTPGEPVQEGQPADWRGADPNVTGEAKSDGVSSGRTGGSMLTMGTMIKAGAGSLSKELGLRNSDPASADISRAPSLERVPPAETNPDLDNNDNIAGQVVDEEDEEHQGVRVHGPQGEDHIVLDDGQGSETSSVPEYAEIEQRQDTAAGRSYEHAMAKVADVVSRWKGDGKHGL